MAASPHPDSATRPPRPPVVIPTNKVTVALPFSKITIEEPDRELAELAAIVAELAALVEAAAPSQRRRSCDCAVRPWRPGFADNLTIARVRQPHLRRAHRLTGAQPGVRSPGAARTAGET